MCFVLCVMHKFVCVSVRNCAGGKELCEDVDAKENTTDAGHLQLPLTKVNARKITLYICCIR